MRLAAQSDFFIKTYGPEAGLKRLKEIGYKYVTYTVTERYDEPFTTEWTDKELKEFFAPVGEAAGNNGLEILYTSVACDVYNELLPHTFEARKKMCVQAAKACAYMGCKVIALPACNFHHRVPDAFEASKAVTFELFDEVKAVADQLGIKLAVINIPSRSSQYCYGCSSDDILEICEKYDALAVVDPSAARRSGERLNKTLSRLSDKLAGFVVNDCESSTNFAYMPLMGSLNYPGIIEDLRKQKGDLALVMSYTPVFHRYKHFSDSDGLTDALEKLLYDMGIGIIGNGENA